MKGDCFTNCEQKDMSNLHTHDNKRSSFSGKLGYVLSAAGASVGLGNIWRFPYLAAKYGGGIFLLIYILLALTFGYTMIMAESALGRMTRKSPVGAFQAFGKAGWLSAGGWINAIIPVLIVPYYSVIGGWVIKYLIEYIRGNGKMLAADGYFSEFISDGVSTELCFILFCLFTLTIIYAGVRNGIERVSKFMMPILIVLSVLIAVYSVTRPGAMEGVKYFLVPNVKNFSWMTVVAAMGQMFYSLSIAMGILITFGSYMKKETSLEDSTRNVEVFDTAIAIMAGLMIIPAVFAFSGGDPDTLQAGPALMFITIPKVFENMGFGTVVGILFFLLVLFAAVTSSIALTESAVSTFEDELGWSRRRATVLVGVIMIALGSLSSLGYGPLVGIKIIGMQFLDFFDFLTNSVMMPIAAMLTSLFVSRIVGMKRMEDEIMHGGSTFRRKKIFIVMIKYLCPVFALIILISSVANAFGWIAM
jgi:NSS family neurotransmitter:Na+ symporter